MVACQSSGKDFETSPGVLGSKAHGVHYFRLVKGPCCFSQGYIVGDDYLGCLQLSADDSRILRGFLRPKVMEKAVAVVNCGEKNRVGVVEPTRVLRSLFRRGVLGSCDNGSVEGCILTFGERVLGDSFIFREGN